jgi:hypothetical protein
LHVEKKMTIDIFLIFGHDILAMILFRIFTKSNGVHVLIVELKTLAEQLSACDGCDIPLNLMNIEQERLHGFDSYVSIRCKTIAVLFHWSLSRRFPWIG